jgi:hypothetical protein
MNEPIPLEVKATVKRFGTWLGVIVVGAVSLGVLATRAYQVGTPSSLVQARLDGRAWSDGEVEQARAVTHKQLKALARALDDADKKGDMALAMQVANETTPVLRTWNDQAPGIKQLGRDCVVAALHVSHGADSVAVGQGWSRRQFDAAMADCRP